MIHSYLKNSAAALLLALPAIGLAQTPIPLGVDTNPSIAKGMSSYTISLDNIGKSITGLSSNEDIIVTPGAPDKYGDIYNVYTGLFARVDWDEDYQGQFIEDNFIQSPPCIMHIDEEARTLTFNWTGFDNADWKSEVSYWNQYVSRMTEGVARLTIPEGLLTINTTDGTFVNAETVINYGLVGNVTVGSITSVTPTPGSTINELSTISMNISFGDMETPPTALSREFVPSDVRLDYTAPGADKPVRQYELKNFSFNDGKLEITFSKSGAPFSFTEPGLYTLNAAPKAIVFAEGTNGETTAVAPSFSYSWTIEKPSVKYQNISPAPGTINNSINPEGPAAFSFTLSGASKADYGKLNPDKLAYASLYRDGEIIARVPNTNFQLIKYDNILANVWNIAFWTRPEHRASAPGVYTAVLDEGFFVLGGVLSEERTLTWTISKDFEINPATCTLPELRPILITFPTATSLTINQGDTDETRISFERRLADDEEEDVNPWIDFSIATEGNRIEITPTGSISTPGKYDLLIPAGVITLIYGEGENAETSSFRTEIFETYTINKNNARPVWTLDQTLQYLPYTFTLNAPEDVTFGMLNNMADCPVYTLNEDGSFGAVVARYRGAKTDGGKTLTFTNKEGNKADLYIANGKYAFELAAGYTIVGDNTWSTPVTYFFSVYNENKPYTSTPYEGQYIKEFSTAEITFKEDVKIVGTQPANISDGITSILGSVAMKEGDSKSVVITAFQPNPLTFTGNYVITLPAGSIMTAEADKETGLSKSYDVRVSFNIVGENDQFYIPYPDIAPGEYGLPGLISTITLTYPENGQVNSEILPVFYKGEGESRELLFSFDKASVKDNVVTLEIAEKTLELGAYQLVVPEGFFFTDNAISKEFTYTFTVVTESVEAINAIGDDTITVYNLQGICLLRGVPAERIALLPAGFYIVNGRKVLIRK